MVTAGFRPRPYADGRDIGPLPAFTVREAAVSASSARYPSIDGVRGVAGAGILVYHLFGSRPLGLGQAIMELFFVLSGYLITGVAMDLVAERWRGRTFYVRRARRLLPALFVYLVVGTALAALLGWGADGSVWSMAVASAAYVANWWEIAHPTADIRPFGGLWSLSIEEQFYLVWPLVVWAVFGLRRRARLLLAVAAGAAVASLAIRWHADASGWSLLRTRSGLDTRAFALALGAAARTVLPPGRVPRRVATPVALAGVVGYAVSVAAVRTYDTGTFLGWWIVSAAASAAVIVTAASGGLVAATLGCRPLAFLGRISYSLYLWHPAVIAAGEPHLERIEPWARHLVLGAASVAVAWVSYRAVELPFRARGTAAAPEPAADAAAAQPRLR